MNAPEVATTPAAKAAHSTTDLFITVPETRLPGGIVVPSFRVSQYVCTRGADGKAAVTAEGMPWVNINYHEARKACEEAGYALITELQWLAIAYGASGISSNWTSGIEGEGQLFQGIRNWHVTCAQPGTYVSPDSTEQRWLTLSNGERICDLNGNVYQWVFDDVQGDAQGLIARDFAEDSPSITTPPYPSGSHGMGDYEVWNWSGLALLRGGCWYSEGVAGAFILLDGGPGYRHGIVGFRCTLPGL